MQAELAIPPLRALSAEYKAGMRRLLAWLRTESATTVS